VVVLQTWRRRPRNRTGTTQPDRIAAGTLRRSATVGLAVPRQAGAGPRPDQLGPGGRRAVGGAAHWRRTGAWNAPEGAAAAKALDAALLETVDHRCCGGPDSHALVRRQEPGALMVESRAGRPWSSARPGPRAGCRADLDDVSPAPGPRCRSR
jgi:hypothetical protein